MERIAQANARANQDSKTKISITRYGNVMLSRGSVIPLFVNQIRAGKKISLTDPGMTRFLMSLEDAIDLVLYALKDGKNGNIYIPKTPATTIQVLVDSLLSIYQYFMFWASE
jgi:UDP-glucose 4-epimerase